MILQITLEIKSKVFLRHSVHTDSLELTEISEKNYIKMGYFKCRLVICYFSGKIIIRILTQFEQNISRLKLNEEF